MAERMATFFGQLKENIVFVLISAGIILALAIIAKVAERFLPGMRKVSPARRITIVAICAAIAAVLHIFD